MLKEAFRSMTSQIGDRVNARYVVRARISPRRIHERRVRRPKNCAAICPGFDKIFHLLAVFGSISHKRRTQDRERLLRDSFVKGPTFRGFLAGSAAELSSRRNSAWENLHLSIAKAAYSPEFVSYVPESSRSVASGGVLTLNRRFHRSRFSRFREKSKEPSVIPSVCRSPH